MSGKTEISWATHTWSPVLGCLPVSVGCANCYAVRTTWRFAHNPNQKVSGPREGLTRCAPGCSPHWTGKVACLPGELDTPIRWKRPRRIFVCPQGDLFHKGVPDEFIIRVFDVIRRCHTERPGHVFIVLTKRPERMRSFYARLRFDRYGDDGRMWLSDREARSGFAPSGDGYALARALENLWSGVSVENQKTADERIPILLDTPAAHRFVSVEPLIGPVDLQYSAFNGADSLQSLEGIDWVIVGGESGPRARPCDMDWIRSIVVQCKTADVPCFVKQLGDRTQWNRWNPTDRIERDRNGRDPSEWPEDVRVQQFPEGLCPAK